MPKLSESLGFVEQRLRLEKPDAKLVRKVLASKKPNRAALLAALESHVDRKKPPAWLVLATDDLDEVVHLAPPLFTAASADGDLFYDDHCAGQVVYSGKGKAQRFDDERKAKPVKLADKHLTTVTAYQTDGELVLHDLCWHERSPTTVKAFDALLRVATAAIDGELPGYESPAATAKTHRLSTGGAGGTYLGDPQRTSSFATTGPRKKPKVNWRCDVDCLNGDEWGGSPVIADGMIFGGSGGEFGAADLKGRKRWAREMTTSQSWCTTHPCIANGVLYLGNNHGLYALQAATGKTLWHSKITGLSRSSPVVVGEVIIVAAQQQLIALATATGRKQWGVPMKGKNPSQVAANGALVYALADNKLVAMNPETGKIVWSVKCEPRNLGPTIAGGLVVCGDDRKLQAFDAVTGKRAWTSKADIANDHPLAVGADTIVAYDNECARLCGLALATGKLLWTAKHEGCEYGIGSGTCAAAIAGGVAYAFITNGESDRPALGAFDLKSGKQLWKLDALDRDRDEPQEIKLDSSPVVHDGKLYIATNKGVTCLA